MDNKTRCILSELQDGFKLETRPFKRIAKSLDCSEDEVIETIKGCCNEGIIRRLGAAIRPTHIGHAANALVIWQVASDEVEKVGVELAKMREISHCYERECPPEWPYNFFTMIHARSQEGLEEIINNILQRFSLEKYMVLNTVKELKKTSMRYF